MQLFFLALRVSKLQMSKAQKLGKEIKQPNCFSKMAFCFGLGSKKLGQNYGNMYTNLCALFTVDNFM